MHARSRRLVAALALTLTAAAPAAAQTLTFDDRPLGQPVTPLGTTYGGFAFANFFVGSGAGPGTGAGPVSGTQFAYVGHNPMVTYGEIYRPSLFNSVSGFFGYRATGTLGGPAVVTVRGFGAGGEELFTQALTLGTTPTYVELLMPLVDAVEFDVGALTAQEGAGAVMTVDDLRVSTVPEPGTVVLLATGLAGVAGLGYRRRRAT